MLSRNRLKPLRDQVIVITGASSGIGLVTARMAAARGARVVMAARNAEALAAVAEEIRIDGGTVATVTADVAVEADVDRIVRTATERFGGFDTWVNGAAVALYGFLDEVSMEDHRRVFDTNYWGVVYGSLKAVEHLRQKGGAIITIGSILSEIAVPLQGPYVASKHAVRGFTDALRQDLDAEHAPISITLIKPAAIDTPYVDHAKTLFNRQPKTPPVRYAPHIVARAILHCATHPRREMTVGGGGKLTVLMQRAFPAFYDYSVSSNWHTSQMRDAAVGDGDQATRDNLHAPTRDGEERGSPGLPARETSLYTEMRLRPVAALLLAGVALGVGYVVVTRVSTGRWPWEEPPRGWRRMVGTDWLGRAHDTVGGWTGSARHWIGDTAGETQHRLGAAAGTAQHRLGGLTGAAQHRLGALAGSARHALGALGGDVQRRFGATEAETESRLAALTADAGRRLHRYGDAVETEAEHLARRAREALPDWVAPRRRNRWTDWW
ncbi:SDR family oxidoreductase [Mongoliimonas terrestris]|uniref:SDR family oxidoreductase n=1 Tax=Mongoliimonas terrestris TaxID=1709001 RepID=UPI0009498E1C|nr:SDR family oxidoreductase [Mongoliimonas terrestris]